MSHHACSMVWVAPCFAQIPSGCDGKWGAAPRVNRQSWSELGEGAGKSLGQIAAELLPNAK